MALAVRVARSAVGRIASALERRAGIRVGPQNRPVARMATRPAGWRAFRRRDSNLLEHLMRSSNRGRTWKPPVCKSARTPLASSPRA